MQHNFPNADGKWICGSEINKKIWVKSNSVLSLLSTVLCIVGTYTAVHNNLK